MRMLAAIAEPVGARAILDWLSLSSRAPSSPRNPERKAAIDRLCAKMQEYRGLTDDHHEPAQHPRVSRRSELVYDWQINGSRTPMETGHELERRTANFGPSISSKGDREEEKIDV